MHFARLHFTFAASIASLTFLTGDLDAQIFADFQVSKGGTPLGTFRARLDYDKAPRTCANFIGLATGARPWIDVNTNLVVEDTPFYNGRVFHRLIHDFVIQGGSSDGSGFTGSGINIQDEFHPDLRHSGRYFLSMAKKTEPGTGNSQFFITLAATTFLDDKHSVFGEVINGRNIIDDFANSALHPTNSNDRPLTELTMDSVVISGPSLSSFDIHDPALELPIIKGVRATPSRNSAASSFILTFDREQKHDYIYGYSFNLGSWTAFRNILSVDAFPSYTFTTTGLPGSRFFAQLSAVDYSALQNPAPSILGAGSSITFTPRSGDSLTLTPDGSGGGSWSDSGGGSGTLNSFTITELAPQAGDFISTASQAFFLPLLEINFELDAAGGPTQRKIHRLILDFREPLAGWSDGRGWSVASQADRVNFLHEFSVTPAP